MRNKSFTLIEIMVTVSIISLLSIAVLANYRKGDKQFALIRSAHKLAQDLRGAQEKAMASQEFKGLFQGGFGIYFTVTPSGEDTGYYTLFVDCDNDNQYDEVSLTCADCTGASCIANSFSEKVETISLEKGIYISQLLPLSSTLLVKFSPPDPIVIFSPDNNPVSIILTFTGGSQKEIELNKAGLIQIE